MFTILFAKQLKTQSTAETDGSVDSRVGVWSLAKVSDKFYSP